MYKRTNVVIDEEKLSIAKEEYRINTTKDLIDFALDQLIRASKRKEILEMQGKVKLEIDLKKSRKTK